jgi:hypothetical protein
MTRSGETIDTARTYNLVDRELDRNPNAGLKEINEAARYVDDDLRWGHHGTALNGVGGSGNARPERMTDDLAALGRSWP